MRYGLWPYSNSHSHCARPQVHAAALDQLIAFLKFFRPSLSERAQEQAWSREQLLAVLRSDEAVPPAGAASMSFAYIVSRFHNYQITNHHLLFALVPGASGFSASALPLRSTSEDM